MVDKILKTLFRERSLGEHTIVWVQNYSVEYLWLKLGQKFASTNSYKQLKPELGFVSNFANFLLNLYETAAACQDIKKHNFEWRNEHDSQFRKLRQSRNKHFNPNTDSRLLCDASRSGLGAVL